jgi:hypothetical protein
MEANLENIWILLFVAFGTAFFTLGGQLILRYLTSGKVTTDIPNRAELNKVKEEIMGAVSIIDSDFRKHKEQHAKCSTEFVSVEQFEKHLNNCPINNLQAKFIDHEIQHGSLDSQIFTRLSAIEKQNEATSETSKKLEQGLNSIHEELSLLTQKVETALNGGLSKRWNGIERRKSKNDKST